MMGRGKIIMGRHGKFEAARVASEERGWSQRQLERALRNVPVLGLPSIGVRTRPFVFDTTARPPRLAARSNRRRPTMEHLHQFTRPRLIEAFRRWEAKAQAEGWDGPRDPETSADTLISFLSETDDEA
jgi:hypothetical protein